VDFDTRRYRSGASCQKPQVEVWDSMIGEAFLEKGQKNPERIMNSATI
jgi:hypothetical protein